MGRNERYTEQWEIDRDFPEVNQIPNQAGPIVHSSQGKNYFDGGESHIAVYGSTGRGKSACCSTPFAYHCIKKNENLICVDPKGEIYRKIGSFASKSHKVFLIDFSNPSQSPTYWSPLQAPYENYKSDDITMQDTGSKQLELIADNLYPQEGNDPFWPNSGKSFFTGLVYTLFDIARPEEVNLESVSNMMCYATKRIDGFSSNFYIKELLSTLSPNSLAAKNLASFCNAANETRASIHSVALEGIKLFNTSKGLMQMLSKDTLHINNLDINEKPLAIFIILPDQHDTYDFLAAILINQLVNHFVWLADNKYQGKLQKRVNFLLEEMASVAKGIKSSLTKLITAARSRNIRLMMILQDESQLNEIFGKSMASTVKSCIGIQFCFSTNSWETLCEWSNRCGERKKYRYGQFVTEPLITPAQLAAMPVGTALVLIMNRYKYIANFPFFEDMFNVENLKPPKNTKRKDFKEIPYFDIEEYILKKKTKALNDGVLIPPPTINFSRSNLHAQADLKPSTFDINELATRIDEKIAIIEKEQRLEALKQFPNFKIGKTHIFIKVVLPQHGINPSKENNLIHLISEYQDMTALEVKNAIGSDNLFFLPFNSWPKAVEANHRIKELGVVSQIVKSDDVI